MLRGKRFGRSNDDDVFKRIRRKEFSSYSQSIRVSSESSLEAEENLPSPEKSRNITSDRRECVLPSEPQSIDIIAERKHERNEEFDSGDKVMPKLRLARNSTLTAEGKAIDSVTFGSPHLSSIVPFQESAVSGTRVTIDESSEKDQPRSESTASSETSEYHEDTCSVAADSSSSSSDETERGNLRDFRKMSHRAGGSPRSYSKGAQFVSRRTPMVVIEEQTSMESCDEAGQAPDQLSEVEIHIPDKIEKPVPRIITSSHDGRHPSTLPAICEISSITRCGEGDDSSGLVFRPPSREINSSEMASVLSIIRHNSVRPESRKGSANSEESSRSSLVRSYSCPPQCLKATEGSHRSDSKSVEIPSPGPLKDISNKMDVDPSADDPHAAMEAEPSDAKLDEASSEENVERSGSSRRSKSPGIDAWTNADEDYQHVYLPAQSSSIQIGSVSHLAREVMLCDSWTQTSQSVIARELPPHISCQKFVPLDKRSQREQSVIADLKAWIQTIPLSKRI